MIQTESEIMSITQQHSIIIRIAASFALVPTEIELSNSELRIMNRFLYVGNQTQYFFNVLRTIHNPYVPKKNYQVFEIN